MGYPFLNGVLTIREWLYSCMDYNKYVDCVRASGTYVTMSQGQWQHTQQYTTTYVYVVVGAYACCHLSRYKVSIVLYSSLIPLVVSAITQIVNIVLSVLT